MLSHVDAAGRAAMVDVSAKVPTRREAAVGCSIRLLPETFAAVMGGRLAKGDALLVARLAGIQAAKRTADLIPLCHPLPLEHVTVEFAPDPAAHSIGITARTIMTGKTGIEMEAFTAAAVAALTLYDMVKAMDPGATITDLRLLEKSGGKTPYRSTL